MLDLAGSFLRDVRFGFRILLRSPVISASVVIVLALGIVVRAAIYHHIGTGAGWAYTYLQTESRFDDLMAGAAAGFHGRSDVVHGSFRVAAAACVTRALLGTADIRGTTGDARGRGNYHRFYPALHASAGPPHSYRMRQSLRRAAIPSDTAR